MRSSRVPLCSFVWRVISLPSPVEEGRRSNPSFAVPVSRLIDLLAARWAKSARKLRLWRSGLGGVRELRRLAKRGQWDELQKKCASLLVRRPERVEATYWLSVALARQGRWQEALAPALAAAEGELGELKEAADANAVQCFHEAGGFDGTRMDFPKVVLRVLAQRPVADEFLKTIARTHGLHAAAEQYEAWFPERAGHCVVAPVRSVREWAGEHGAPLLEAGEEEDIPFQTPRIWPQVKPNETCHARSNKPYVAEIEDARVFGHSDLVLTPDGAALCDNAAHPRFGRYVSHQGDQAVIAQETSAVLVDIGAFRERQVETAVFMGGSASSHFGHWFPEFLPQLRFFRCHPDFALLPIIVDADMPRSHYEHLRRFVDNPLIELHGGESLRCRRLLVASKPAFSPMHWLPHNLPEHELPGFALTAARFLREGTASEAPATRTGRYYFARRKMHWRRLLNEDEIAAELTRLGFETVFIEDLDMRGQISLFQRAAWIVAPNGSALLNVIFSDPSVRLIILSQPGLFNWGAFEGPLRALGYDPVWICGDEIPADNNKHASYAVPLERITRALAEQGPELSV